MEKHRHGFCTKQGLDNRTRTVSENGSSYGEKRVKPKEKPRDDKQKQSAVINENTGVDTNEEETFRDLILKHSQHSKQRDDNLNEEAQRAQPVVVNRPRPMLQRKSHSDLTSYSNTKVKILVEGKELSGTDTEGAYGSNRFKTSLQEPSINTDHIADGHHSTLRSLVGWFGKAHAKAYELKNAGKNSDETSEKRTPLLKRSRSFSGRIREKLKISFPSTNAKQKEPVFQPPKSNYLQPPGYRNGVEWNRVNGTGVTQFGFPRRHSDQTDLMSRRPLGERRDVRACPAYFSLDRGLRKKSAKKPLTRKRSNSLERQDGDFPFWSQISDADRSRSCAARISVSEPLDTHRDNDGMLETNLCSTEL